jgi:hypothetical protein
MRVVAPVLVAIAALAVAAPAATPRAKPSLRVVDTSPLAVRGAAFHVRERVRVQVSGSATALRIVRASAVGTFTATFPAVFVDRCSDSLAVVAVGTSGARASVKLVPIECPPRD